MFFIDIPILTYHRIAPEKPSRNLGDFCLPVNVFERQMLYLHEHGYVCMQLADLFRQSDSGRFRRKRAFALTFDDGHEDFFTLAFPILRNFGYTATVFVVTGWIRGQGDLEREGSSRHLTWEQIEALRRDGISFGSHTCTHSRLPGLSHEEIRHELVASKECLETRLKQEIYWLAYPYGASTNEIQRMAEVAGYEAAFGASYGKSGRFNVWRRLCLKDDGRLTFALKLNPLYPFFGRLREDTEAGRLLRKIKNRMIHGRRSR